MRYINKMTYYESEKTNLLYVKKNNGQESKIIMPLTNFNILFNQEVGKVFLYVDNKLDDLGSHLDRFNFDVTNDPKTNPKFNITNLGYYSIRIVGRDCEVYHFNNETLFVFEFSKFNIHFNLSLYLPMINNKNFTDQFILNKSDKTLFYRFEFNNKNNYNIDTYIHRNDCLTGFNMDLLRIDNNYKFKSKKMLSISSVLKQFNLI